MKFEKIVGFEAVVFGLVLLFLPTNLAKHFFFDFAFVDGILVDYLIPTVYLTDILIWGLLGFWAFRAFKGFSVNNQQLTINNPLLLYSLFFILVSGLSIFSAQNQPAAVYKWLKLVEYILFALYVSNHIDLKKDFFTIVRLISVGVLFESVLAIAQWFNQGSIFGFWFFGENKYTVSTPGIAILDFVGVRKARPYGTFPHPNVLGGYLAIILPLVFYVGIRGVKGIKERVFYFLVLGLGLAALLLSFSRSAWVVGFLGLVVTFFLFFTSSSRCSSFSHLSLSSFIISSPLYLFTSLSFLRRAELNWIALEMIKDKPFLGVGLNNFTVAMGKYGEVSGWTRFLQPVHNIYLLLAAETGLLGLFLFLFLLFTIYYLLLQNKSLGTLRPLLLVSVTQIVLLAFFDHYFFTLQQTSLLFWLLVGLAFLEYNQKGNEDF